MPVFLASLSPEISVKSRGTKEFFVEAVVNHLLSRSKVLSLSLAVERLGARLKVIGGRDALHLLQTQFGFSKIEFCGRTVKAVGGFPVGVGGRVVHLFSGGPDSLLSAFLLARRGNRVELLFLDDGVPGRRERVISVARKLALFMPYMELTLWRMDYRAHLEALREKAPKRRICLYCKALMLKVASTLAERLGAEAVSTGEIVGEQASQTLPAISVTHRFASKPVLTPLSGFCKEDVFRWLNEFGLRDERNFSMPDCPYFPGRAASAMRGGFSGLKETIKSLPVGKFDKIRIAFHETFL